MVIELGWTPNIKVVSKLDSHSSWLWESCWSLRTRLSWMLTGWHHWLFLLMMWMWDIQRQLSQEGGKKPKDREGSQSPEIISSRSSVKQKSRPKEMGLVVDVTISYARHIWYHFALLAPAFFSIPCCFLSQSQCSYSSFSGNISPSPLCLLHFYSSLSFLYLLFSQLTSLARLTSP